MNTFALNYNDLCNSILILYAYNFACVKCLCKTQLIKNKSRHSIFDNDDRIISRKCIIIDSNHTLELQL